MRASWSFRCEPLNRVAGCRAPGLGFRRTRSRRTSANARGVGEARRVASRGGSVAGGVRTRAARGNARAAKGGAVARARATRRKRWWGAAPPCRLRFPRPRRRSGAAGVHGLHPPPRRFASSSILSAARGGSWVGHERGAAGIDRPPARGPPHADARKKRPRGAKKRRGWHEKPPRGDARFGGRVGRVSARVPDCLPVRITPRGTNARGKDSPRGRSRFADSPVGRDRPSRDECWKSRRRARRTLRAAQISARGSGAIGSVEERLTRRAKPSRNPSS